MAMFSRQLLVVIALATICFLVVIWLGFNLNASHVFGQYHSLLFVLAGAGILPIPFYYYMAKRSPRRAIALAVLAGGLILSSVFIVASFVFGLDNIWVHRTFDLGQLLIVLACLIFIWQGVRKSRKKNEGASKQNR